MEDIFGLLGLVLIFIAWLPGINDTIKSGKPGMKKRFMLIYFLGSSSLAFYAYQLNSMPFLIMNSLAAMVPIVHFYYYIRTHGTEKLLSPTPES